ncbi:NAD(P)-dependent oxidoreductase [Mycolicibacterium duvalii]|uniref:NmrA family transcriptional regulator n=1 Tax=Mycolicibacterium duvalii TaxID=39688 RepID=A0A7I7K5L5_9MYCO|nr:NAD(P)H-binding protein [Mycolicibacterium duvalii]MCV7365870.1 NAD(P)H-binding protein [Mycolicibacterium duvalii]PEG34973.1 NAD(P)-dependent oxidoreductase [Mycolicibacterium duvalii]BBX19375.1 NmrA family transcriptional regulator [Mycolicibacterium duvalii]
MTTETFLVLGASGKTGRRVAARLRLRGLAVRSASRSSETRFDWSDPAGWDAALTGVDAVYVVAPAAVGPVHKFVAHARDVGVRRLVLLSGRGADTWGDSDFGRDMRDAEDAVRGSGLEWTVLRPNNFAQNFDEELWHAPVKAGKLALPAGDIPEPFVDLEDVADVAATVLTEPGRHSGKTYELSGPRAITFAEAAELIARAAGRPVAYERISPAEYAVLLQEHGLTADDAHHVTEMFVLMERAQLAGTTNDVATVLGRQARAFEDYVLRVAASGVWSR